jgi:rRNA N6-adenosine-methyltransferase METTL5
MKVKQIESRIQEVCPNRTFSGTPQIDLEQYSTPVRLAAEFLSTIQSEIEDSISVDLGCGCGVLSAGLGILGTSQLFCFDIDPNCISITQSHLSSHSIAHEAILADISKLPTKDFADLAITNPPFGTRNAGIDWIFVEKALGLAPNVYSFHKSSTRKFFVKKCKEIGIEGSVLMTVPFNLPKTYKMHQKKGVNVEVDIWQFCRDSR